MSRQTALIAIVIIAILATVLTIVSFDREVAPGASSEVLAEAPASGEEELEAPNQEPADLYFPTAGGWLQPQRRDVPSTDAIAERIKAVVEALLAGPGGADSTVPGRQEPGLQAQGLSAPGLHAPLPEGITVRRVYLAQDGTAYLDLQSPEGASPPPSGSRQEILTVYSVVNTVLLNFEDVERLVLLWNGRQPRTFAGHLDTMRPLIANTDLIARAP